MNNGYYRLCSRFQIPDHRPPREIIATNPSLLTPLKAIQAAMGLIPHRPIYLTSIRVTDVWFLLGIGAFYELLARLYVLSVKIKPQSLSDKEGSLAVLQLETDAKRKLGPSAFVEASKLERQVLALEKELEILRAERKDRIEKVEKVLLKGGRMRLAFLVFILYYSVPMFSLDDVESSQAIGEYVSAEQFTKNLFFPISYSGFGYRISKIGLDPDIAASSIGALVVMWSAQTTVEKLMDAMDAYVLC